MPRQALTEHHIHNHDDSEHISLDSANSTISCSPPISPVDDLILSTEIGIAVPFEPTKEPRRELSLAYSFAQLHTEISTGWELELEDVALGFELQDAEGGGRGEKNEVPSETWELVDYGSPFLVVATALSDSSDDSCSSDLDDDNDDSDGDTDEREQGSVPMDVHLDLMSESFDEGRAWENELVSAKMRAMRAYIAYLEWSLKM
jgi:hypothetical protein